MEPRVMDFVRASRREPHRDRAHAILRAHPEVRRCFGHNPATLLVVLGLVAIQVSLAAWARSLGWAGLLLLAYAVGAFVNHGLLVMVHESAHHLVFRRRALNVLTGILAGLPSILLNSVTWGVYHLRHHAHQGVYAQDYDLPSRWEARLVGHSAIGKALWLLLFPLVLVARPFRSRHERGTLARGPWVIGNLAAQLGFGVSVGMLLGGEAVTYLIASLFFSVGLHPLGGRWIQEHLVTAPGQETYSYYGPLNRVAFNVGYHTEHHDFSGVSWNNLPRVRRLAPEAYGTLAWHPSWTALVCRFVLDPDLGLFHRVVRTADEPRVGTAA